MGAFRMRRYPYVEVADHLATPIDIRHGAIISLPAQDALCPFGERKFFDIVGVAVGEHLTHVGPG